MPPPGEVLAFMSSLAGVTALLSGTADMFVQISQPGMLAELCVVG